MRKLFVWMTLAGGCALTAVNAKPADPTPGEPLSVTMGQRTPVRVRVAKGQVTLIRLPEGQRVMNTYGGDKGEGGVWLVDAGKVPTRFLAVKPKEIGIRTILHVVSNTGQEISIFCEEVTGQDTQFDAQVDVNSGVDDSTTAAQIRWVPVEDVASCKAHIETLKDDAVQAAKKAQEQSAAALADYEASYPRKLFFGYEWDQAKAERLGLQMAWSDDKFTYFRGDKVLALYEINEDGKPSLIQYKYADGLYTVPKLLFDGYFAIGTKKENKLTFHREREQVMIGDPYEDADSQQRQGEAKLVPPVPARRDRRIFVVGMVVAGLVFGLIILANIAGLVTGRRTPNASQTPKPTTMTTAQSATFARQQEGQAEYMKGLDRDRNVQNAEDTILGHGSDLAGTQQRDVYDEADGVAQKTKAQDDAEHGHYGGAGSGKSEAHQRHERAALLAEHRRQNDLDSSPVSIDFSEYFNKEKEAAEVPGIVKTEPQTEASSTHRRAALADALSEDGQPAEIENASSKKPHDPKEDYRFDSAGGKLYRLMEDTILESVLVNRLTGASVGPVITMVTTDIYSMNGAHLLIPKGTRLLGRVSAVGSLNQERLFVAFHRMIMPDGYSVSLDKFQGLDVVGQTGLRDLVNHHYVRIFGASLALAAIAATAQIGNTASYGTYDWSVQMRSGISESMSQSAQRVLERFMNTLPTFTIRERSRVKIMLTGDLLLPDIKSHSMDPEL